MAGFLIKGIKNPKAFVLKDERWDQQMGELTSLPNIGLKLESQLQEIGIETIAELRTAGSREAWLRILSRDPSA